MYTVYKSTDMKKKLLTLFVREVAASLEKEGHYGTAHVYRSTANSLRSILRESVHVPEIGYVARSGR